MLEGVKSDLPEPIPTEVFFRDRPTSYFHRIWGAGSGPAADQTCPGEM